MTYTRYIHNVSGGTKTYRGVPISDGAYYEIAAANLHWYQTSDAVIADLGNDEIRMSANGTSDLSTSRATNMAFLLGERALDPDTGAPLTSSKKLADGFYFQCREIEWETSKLNSLHDKDLDQDDLGVTTIKYYDSNRDELTSPSQATLDSSCRYTRVDFTPGTAWGIRGLLVSHKATITDNCYVYGEMYLNALGAALPQADGGLNLYFLDAYGSVGVDEDNFTYFGSSDYLRFWCYHDAGYNHRMQVRLKICLPIPS